MVCIGAGEIANQLRHTVELISTSSDATRIAHRSSIMAFFGSRGVINIDHIQKQRVTKKRQLSSGRSFQFLTFRLPGSNTKVGRPKSNVGSRRTFCAHRAVFPAGICLEVKVRPCGDEQSQPKPEQALLTNEGKQWWRAINMQKVERTMHRQTLRRSAFNRKPWSPSTGARSLPALNSF
jgi:hypothetical protein